MTWRDAIKELKWLGASVVSREGSHETYKLPNGTLFTVLCLRPNEQMPKGYVSGFKRALKADKEKRTHG